MNLFLFLPQRSFDACKATLPPLLVSLMPALVETLRKLRFSSNLRTFPIHNIYWYCDHESKAGEDR